jgi:Protein of unknown function (DUF2530)
VGVPSRPAPTRKAPPPLQVDTFRVVLAGTAVWAVALVVLLLLGDRVDRMWTWTCVAGIGLAAIGVGIMRWQGQLPARSGTRRGHDERSDSSGSP